MALNGSLDDYSPAGALRVLSSTGRTGAVRFTGSAGCTAYLCDGQLYFARGEETDDALAAALVRPGRLTPEAWTAAVEEAGDSPRVGELLIASGAIDPDLLASVVLSVIYDPLITLFREGDGRFDFEADTMHWIGPYRGFNVEAIVNEVRRRVRHVDEMSDVVPSTSAWVSACRTLPDGAAQVTLLREDWELVTALSGPRTVRELAGAMGRGQYSTAQVVHRLARAGLVEVVPEPFGPGDEAIHEPSAAERMARGGIDLDEDAASEPTILEDPVAPTGADLAPSEPATDRLDAPADDEPGASPFGPVLDDPFAPRDTGGDAGWGHGWDVPGNPFERDPEPEPMQEVGLTFGALPGAALGPEIAPDDESQLLPRRAAVREADPPAPWETPAEVEVREPGAVAEDEVAPGLAGIVGFHDPMAEVSQRENTALAAAMTPDKDPNAAWLENLYAQFIDDDAAEPQSKSRKKEALDVAFQAPDQAEGERTGTLRRLVDALRRL